MIMLLNQFLTWIKLMNSYLKEILISVIYWTLASLFLITVRFVGIDFFLESPLGISLFEIYFITLIGGLILGLLWALMEIAANKFTFKKRKSFGFLVLSKTVVYTILFFIFAFISSWLGE